MVGSIVVCWFNGLIFTRIMTLILGAGMALRLAYDLGLHIDMQNYVANGSISPAEAEARRVTFWGTYVVDQ